MTDPYRPRHPPGPPCGEPSLPFGDASYYEAIPRDSFMMVWFDIPPGDTVVVSSNDKHLQGQWFGGSHFYPQHCIYIGTDDLWLRSDSRAGVSALGGAELPMSTYRLPAPTFVRWPVFSCLANNPLELHVQNRGAVLGQFVARIAGEFTDPNKMMEISSSRLPGLGWRP